MRYCLVIHAIAWSSCALAAEFHVATAGHDANPGTQEAPFATLNRAREAVRTLKQAGDLPEGGVTVWIHAGAYHLSESFALGAEDSGTPGKPIVYRNVANELVRLVGGTRIPPEAFAPATDSAVLERIEEGVRGNVLVADLNALGIQEHGEMPWQFVEPPIVPELFMNDRRMTLARWPNEGWAEIARVVESGPAPWRGFESDKAPVFEYAGDRPSRWLKAPAVWLNGYWCFDWASDTTRVASIDPATKQITLAKPHAYGLGGGNPAPRRYCAVNLLEELDQRGEYHLDPQAGRLYFLAPGELSGAQIVLSTLKTPVIEMKEAAYVTLQGVCVEACCANAIEIHGGKECRIAACTIRNAGHAGAIVDGGEAHRVIACDIYDTGTAGLVISGGDRKTLTPCRHEAINNDIHHVSCRRRTHAYHVHIDGVGVRLAHNALHDAPHQSIGLSGNDHVIELNEIYRVSMESDDCGAFYMGRNPSDRGTMLRHNYWHDVGSSFSHGSCAIYFDDGDGGQRVFGNVFYRAAGGNFGAVFSHGGHDNWVENNIFIECKRAMGHAPWNDARWNEWLASDLCRERALQEVDITKPPYSDRYTELAGFLEPVQKMRVNHALKNVIFRCGDAMNGDWQAQDNWVTTEDPGFADAAALNFALREDAPAFKQIPGFEPIPFDKIGLYVDELRPNVPKQP